eukprot:362856-Chlamydomonas_euryale.AAC.6
MAHRTLLPGPARRRWSLSVCPLLDRLLPGPTRRRWSLPPLLDNTWTRVQTAAGVHTSALRARLPGPCFRDVCRDCRGCQGLAFGMRVMAVHACAQGNGPPGASLIHVIHVDDRAAVASGPPRGSCQDG